MPPLNAPARAGYTTDLSWRPAVAAGDEVPAFALVRVTGRDAAGVYTVDQPDADGGPAWVNSPVLIEAAAEGGGGAVTPAGPADALYESADGTPAVGETWGAGAGSWKLRKGLSGFLVVAAGDPDSGTCAVLPVPVAGGDFGCEISQLETSYNITTNNVWQDVGPALVVTQPGRYFVWAQAAGVMELSSLAGAFHAELAIKIVTDPLGTGVGGALFPSASVCGTETAGEYVTGSATVATAIDVGAEDVPLTFKLQAMRGSAGGTGPTWTYAIIAPVLDSTVNERPTFIAYMKPDGGAAGPTGATGAAGAAGADGVDGSNNPESENGTVGAMVFGP